MKKVRNKIVIVVSKTCPGCNYKIGENEHVVFVPDENKLYHQGCYECRNTG